MNLDIAPITERPFPHSVVDDYLDADLYRELSATFPECQPNTGPTGYTCFWGDDDYAALMDRVPAWKQLFDRVHSQAFIDYSIAQFRQVFAEEATVDLSRARYVPYLESRENKQRRQLDLVSHAPDELWVRLDIMQGRQGYTRGRHLDHRRRAISMLIYFCDGDENAMVGGDLQLFGRKGVEARIRPRHNRMVVFPCHKDSFHAVSPILNQAKLRNFVQVTVSSSVDLWRKPLVDLEEAKENMKRMTARARRLLPA